MTSKRAIKTAVLAEHGQTVVLGGLVSDDTSLSRQGIPGLSSIPYVGRLFRSDNRSNVKRNLLVFIHPTIVGDANDVRRLSQQRYNQLYSLQLAMDKMATLQNYLSKLMIFITKNDPAEYCL